LNTVPTAVVETNASAQALVTPQVVLLDVLAGVNSQSWPAAPRRAAAA
jgi:hypothetical protein